METDLDKLVRETLIEKARTNFIRIDGVFLPENYVKFADAIENFQVRDDDVWVCSFIKAGTTWTQEMVWNITHDLNFETAKAVINSRFPLLEFSGTITAARIAINDNNTDVELWIQNSIDYCKNLPSPRHIKSHLPFNLLPRQIRNGEKKPKIISIARNSKDVCISFYHYSKLFEGYCGTFEQFCELFLADRVLYAPYWNNVIGFWEKQNMNNFLFLKFEDMKKDLQSVIRMTASFLGKSLNDEQVKLLADHLSFAKMKNNPSVNRVQSLAYLKNAKIFGDLQPKGDFMRNGNIGQWKEKMSDKMIHRFDKWIEENLINHKDLRL